MNPEKAICGLQSSLITLTCIIGSRGGHTRLKTLVLERSLVSQGKALQPWHALDFKELCFKVGPSFIGYRRTFSTPIQDNGFVSLKTSISDRSWNWMVLTKEGGTNLETKLLKVRHSSRPNFYYLGLPTSSLKPTFSDTCGLPFSSLAALCTHANLALLAN